jgi:putative holliday junction resolvase
MPNTPKKGKILALDMGRSAVGMAISDEQREMVFGRGVIRNYKSLANLFDELKAFCVRENVEEVVVGLPVGRDGEDTAQTERIRSIGERLEVFLGGIPVEFEDESFTTFEANEFLGGVAGVKVRNRKDTEDEIAAVIILKRYLDFEES